MFHQKNRIEARRLLICHSLNAKNIDLVDRLHYFT